MGRMWSWSMCRLGLPWDMSMSTCTGSVFYKTHTFELFAFTIMRDYKKLADRFVGRLPEDGKLGAIGQPKAVLPQCGMDAAEVEKLIKARLRACWWGPRAKGVVATGAEMLNARDVRPWEQQAKKLN